MRSGSETDEGFSPRVMFVERTPHPALRATFSHKGRRRRETPRGYLFFAIRRQCAHAAAIRFSLASGVRNAECADSVTFSSFVSG
jgi:hypothetical protein